jgi:hypothetical protein
MADFPEKGSPTGAHTEQSGQVNECISAIEAFAPDAPAETVGGNRRYFPE